MTPFEAFVDLAGRFGWDAQQVYAGGLFRDTNLQNIWDALARTGRPYYICGQGLEGGGREPSPAAVKEQP